MKNILLVDAGNSRLKWAVLSKSEVSTVTAILYGTESPVDSFSELVKANQENLDRVVLVSVKGKEFVEQAKGVVRNKNIKFTNIVSLEKVGEFKNAYENPKKLGADRFVAMLAGYNRAKNQASIIVDCGTAVTIDAIDEKGQHLGGLILPGLQVASNSLVEGTQQLELDDDKKSGYNLFAKNTNLAILSGSYYGLCGAINQICSQIEKEIFHRSELNNVVKIICGGDASTLLPELSSSFQLKEELVIEGLSLIAEQYLGYWDKESKK